ncbi:tetratricopeptide repeat protein [Luteibacter flocculans]|uniref:Tetratricopeptide repeat protein n=1 Tax=Luteibacter flocculans TaxID=2780091 RepID=A0ABY4SZH3_9GAMM|nr:tetratricopeptide repeat protein [Luteibacter flocculans]URL58097.1 tetratricopeptide repeat protein [Luteibacter flocculans]
MTTWLRDFHFIEPHWLWLLVLVPVLAWLVGRRPAEQRVLARLADPALLPYLLDGEPSAARAPVAAFVSAALLAIVALAGPTWDKQAQPLFAERAAQVVVVSMSPHMLSHDVVPDRLSRVRYKIRELYAANGDGMNALIAYTGEAFTVAPLTTDAHSVDDLLTALAPDTMPVEGDDPGKAIDQAADLIRHAGLRGGSIVLVTDRADGEAVAAARRARAAGDRVSVLGVGSTRGGPIPTSEGGFLKDEHGAIVMAPRDDASLGAVAEAGGGRFVPVADDSSDVKSLASLVRGDGDAKAINGATSGQWQDRGPWLLLPLLPIVALAFRRGWLLVLALAFVPLSPARADGLTDLFRTRDQQAAQALAQGDAKRAQTLAHDPALRGAAAYRAGDYAAAETAFAQRDDAESQYNLGNALAKQQRYEDALAAYDRALKRDPHHADAAANRKAVADFLKQQQQKKSEQDKNKQGGKGEQDKNQQQSSGNQDKDQQQGQEDGKDGQQGQSGKQSGADGKDGGNEAGAKDKAGEGDGADRSQDNGKGQAPQGDAAAKSEAQQAQAKQAQEALKEKMDAALAGKANGKPGERDHDLGTMAGDDASSKLPPDVQRALMRVPDDPGGLLRRKFMLEYQRRHGAEPEE